MKKLSFMIAATVLLASCTSKKIDTGLQGKTEKEEISVVGKIPGRIEMIFVQTGDFVKKGDTLAILDIPELSAKREQAEGAVKAATAQYNMTTKGATDNQLKQLMAKKAALQEQFNYADKSLQRLQNMLSDSLIPQQQYDEVYAKHQGALAQLTAVKAEIADVQNGVRIEQQTMALGQRERALGAMSEVEVAEKERVIIAPADMTIEVITLREGELALPGYTLFKGTMPNTTYFRFTIAESKLDKVKEGTAVIVHVPYKDIDVVGTVSLVKVLPFYADIPTAYPDYDLQESLFEIRVTPSNQEEVKDIYAKTTTILKLQ